MFSYELLFSEVIHWRSKGARGSGKPIFTKLTPCRLMKRLVDKTPGFPTSKTGGIFISPVVASLTIELLDFMGEESFSTIDNSCLLVGIAIRHGSTKRVQ